MRVYYRPRGSPWGISFRGGWGLLVLLFALPALLAWWLFMGFDGLLKRLGIPREARRGFAVLLVAGLVWWGDVNFKHTEAQANRAAASYAVTQWIRNDPHCVLYKSSYGAAWIDQTRNPVYPTPCTPTGMRSGFYGGKLVNDPNCTNIGVYGTG